MPEMFDCVVFLYKIVSALFSFSDVVSEKYEKTSNRTDHPHVHKYVIFASGPTLKSDEWPECFKHFK